MPDEQCWHSLRACAAHVACSLHVSRRLRFRSLDRPPQGLHRGRVADRHGFSPRNGLSNLYHQFLAVAHPAGRRMEFRLPWRDDDGCGLPQPGRANEGSGDQRRHCFRHGRHRLLLRELSAPQLGLGDYQLDRVADVSAGSGATGQARFAHSKTVGEWGEGINSSYKAHRSR